MQRKMKTETLSKSMSRCEEMNVLSDCNNAVALGCSGLGGRLVIEIDASHHYFVPQQRQKLSIHHSVKFKMHSATSLKH